MSAFHHYGSAPLRGFSGLCCAFGMFFSTKVRMKFDQTILTEICTVDNGVWHTVQHRHSTAQHSTHLTPQSCTYLHHHHSTISVYYHQQPPPPEPPAPTMICTVAHRPSFSSRPNFLGSSVSAALAAAAPFNTAPSIWTYWTFDVGPL